MKAQIFTHLLYRHWDHYTGDKRSHLFLVSVETGAMRDLKPGDTHDVPPFSLEGGAAAATLRPMRRSWPLPRTLDPVPAISTSVSIFTLDLTDPAAKPVKVSTSPGGNFNPAYSPDGKWLAWRIQARAGYESDKFRLVLYDRAAKTIKDLMPKFDNWVDEFAWDRTIRSAIYCSQAAIRERHSSSVWILAGQLYHDVRDGWGVQRPANFQCIWTVSSVAICDACCTRLLRPWSAICEALIMITDWSRTLRALGHTINPDRKYTSAIV